MLLKNPALAGATLGLGDGSGGTVTGDPNGVFDLPDALAKKLEGTPGWSRANSQIDPEEDKRIKAEEQARAEADRKAAQAKLDAEEAKRKADAEAAKEAEAKAENVAADEDKAQAEATAAREALEAGKTLAANEPDPEDDEDDDEGPDLDALNKEELLQVAEQYDVKVNKRWGEAKLRKQLDAALYGEDEGDN